MKKQILLIGLILGILLASGCSTQPHQSLTKEGSEIKEPKPDLSVAVSDCSWNEFEGRSNLNRFWFMFNITVGNNPTRLPASIWFEPEEARATSMTTGHTLERIYYKGERIRQFPYWDGIEFYIYMPVRNDTYYKLYYCENSEFLKDENCMLIFISNTALCKS